MSLWWMGVSGVLAEFTTHGEWIWAYFEVVVLV